MRGRGERIERMDDSNKTTQQEGDSTLENDIITQCIDTQEEERERKEVKGKAGYREGIIVLQSRDGTAPAPQRPTVPGCARRRQGSCPRVHRVDAHASASPSAHGSAQDAALSA